MNGKWKYSATGIEIFHVRQFIALFNYYTVQKPKRLPSLDYGRFEA